MSDRGVRSRARGVGWLVLLAAGLAGIVGPTSARAQTASPSSATPFAPPKIAFMSGTVTAVDSFDLEQVERVGGTPNGAIRFSIAVIEKVAAADPFPIPDSRAEVRPFTRACTKYFAIFSGATPDEVKGLVGKTIEGSVSLDKPEQRAEESKSECVLGAGIERVLPNAKRASFDLFRVSDTKGTLDQLRRARALFEPETQKVRFYDQTPLDSAIEYAFRDMKSRDALELALEMRMFSAIQLNAGWENDPASYPLFEKAVVEGPDDAHPKLAALLWQVSATRARAKVAELAATRPELAGALLRSSAGWLGASSLLEELVDARKVDLGHAWALLGLGTEDGFLEKHRGDTAAFTVHIDKALGASKERREMGITDGWSLVRWIAKNKKTPRHDAGMRVTLVGQKALCCDMRGLVSDDVDFEARVGCDAEQRRAFCDVRSTAPITATGVVKSAQYTTHRLKPGAPERPIVRVDLEFAAVAAGGEVPAPASLEDAPVVAAAPAEDAPSGCRCALLGADGAAVGGGSVAGGVAVLAFAVGALRRRTIRDRNAAGARANPARGRAG